MRHCHRALGLSIFFAYCDETDFVARAGNIIEGIEGSVALIGRGGNIGSVDSSLQHIPDIEGDRGVHDPGVGNMVMFVVGIII